MCSAHVLSHHTYDYGKFPVLIHSNSQYPMSQTI